MYKVFLRPILFLFAPERIHEILVSLIKFLHRIPFIPVLFKRVYCIENQNLETEFLGLKFKNPVGLAAGFDKNAGFYKEFSSFGFGFIEIGTVTPRAQPGNPKPRSFRLVRDKAIINRMGLNNLGVDAAVDLLKNRNKEIIIGGNIGKNTGTPDEQAKDEFLYCFEKLYDFVDYFVVNISCPNTGEIEKLQDQAVMESILEEIVQKRALKSAQKPVLLKISPDLNFEQIDEVLFLVKKYGIDGIVATNTTISRRGLKSDENHIKSIGNGGLSGDPLRNRSNEIIRYISEKTDKQLPIIGVGGIMSTNDAMEKMEAGAGLIQVYTGFVYEGPGFVKAILKTILKSRRKLS
ncbi:MAG: quinone-dependent dihydroorotate dehydrogenase [Bacteroidales bacterium]|nr:quinone-dependent dihydroorotate dehydrogenase [Bacteroidales bacterium]